jgi:hypothetical protein
VLLTVRDQFMAVLNPIGMPISLPRDKIEQWEELVYEALDHRLELANPMEYLAAFQQLVHHTMPRGLPERVVFYMMALL